MWGQSPPPKMGRLGGEAPSLELTHFVIGSVMFFVVFPAFCNLYTLPKTPSFPTGPTSLLGVLRASPHILLILEHKIMWFLLIFWVFRRKNDAEYLARITGLGFYHLRADPGNGPCQRQVLAEYTNNNNNNNNKG